MTRLSTHRRSSGASAEEKSRPSLQELGPAGILDSFLAVRSGVRADPCVVVLARYESNRGRPLNKANLFPALEHVVHNNAALSARLSSHTPSAAKYRPPVWLRLPSIDLNKAVDFLDLDSSNLESIAAAQLARPFDQEADLPLWRLTVLLDCTVILAYDHAIGDGQSGRGFHLSLLAALQNSHDCPEHSGIISPASNRSLVPPLEDIIPLPTPLSALMRELNNALNPFSRQQSAALWTGNPAPNTWGYDVGVRILHWTPEETSRILERCRAHHTTLTGALGALIPHIIAHLLPAGHKYKSIAVFVPISLRPYTGASPTAICNHVSYYQSFFDLPKPQPSSTSASPTPDNFPWEIARRFSEKLKRKAPKSPATIGVMNALIGGRAAWGYYRGLLGKKRESTVELSNLGPVPPLVSGPDDGTAGNDSDGDGGSNPYNGEWSISQVVFVQGDVTTGAALKVNVAGTPAGGLGISLTWGKKALDEAFANDYVSAFQEALMALAAPGL